MLSDGRPEVIGYVRVSTEEQANSGLGIEAQQALILRESSQRGWAVVRWAIDDGVSAKYGVARPALEEARAECRAHGRILMAAKVDRVTRSARLLSELMHESKHRIVFLDMGGIDTATPAGKMFCMMVGIFAEFERDLTSERTKAALAAKRARGERLGAARSISPDVEREIRTLSDRGLSIRAIAGTLQARGIPTPKGGPWRHSSVQAVLAREPLDIAKTQPSPLLIAS